MKTQMEQTETQPGKTRLFITGCMLACLTAGWLLGSTTTKAFSQQAQSSSESTTLLSVPMNGETLPTLMLDEFSVSADSNMIR